MHYKSFFNYTLLNIGRCMVGWTNLLHNQNSYVFKKMVKLWKLQLVYTYFLHISSMSLMAHLEFLISLNI